MQLLALVGQAFLPGSGRLLKALLHRTGLSIVIALRLLLVQLASISTSSGRGIINSTGIAPFKSSTTKDALDTISCICPVLISSDKG